MACLSASIAGGHGQESRIRDWVAKEWMIRDMPGGLARRGLVTESSILAQNERWRRVLSMQVERMRALRSARKRRTGE